jgi:metallophosphoesterase (TIGR00282 family)
MNILFCGDVVGRVGKTALAKYLPILKTQLNLDFIIVNADNASGGFGLNQQSCLEIFGAGANVITGGDHIWDNKEVNNLLATNKNILRPANFPPSSPGNGFGVFEVSSTKKILVLHLMGQVFMKYNVDCPFAFAEKVIKNHSLGKDVDAIFVDFHAEATSEKMAMAKFLDGKITALVGSHTHIPTNDCHIMKGGTAYQTDAGMCGDYDSVIGMEKNVPIQIFLHKRKTDKMQPATQEATFCGCFISANQQGLASKITPIKLGGILGD